MSRPVLLYFLEGLVILLLYLLDVQYKVPGCLYILQSLPVCPSICPSVCLSICPSVRLSICLSDHLSFWPSVRLTICPSVCRSIWPSVHLTICCQSVCPSVHLSVWPSAYLSFWRSDRLCAVVHFVFASWSQNNAFHLIIQCRTIPSFDGIFEVCDGINTVTRNLKSPKYTVWKTL